MLRWKPFPLTLALIACGCPLAVAQSEPDSSDKLLQAFYVKLCTLARGGEPAGADITVALSVPGVVLEPLDSKEPRDVEWVNAQFDDINLPKGNWVPSGNFISRTYKTILDNHVVNKPPKLDTETQKQLDDALALLDPESKTMEAFNKYKEAYDDAVSKRDVEMYESNAAGHGMTAAQKTLDAVSTADNNWKIYGKKQLILDAQDTVNSVYNDNPGAWWTEAAADFRADMVKKHPLLDVFPRMETWAKDTGWMEFKFKNAEKMSSSESSTRDAKAAASLRVGGLKVAGDVAYSDAFSKAMSGDSSLEMSMQVKRVFIQRAWLHPEVFADRSWVWNATKRGTVISNGGILGQQPPPQGEMPQYCIAFLIVRKVVFKSQAFAKFQSELSKTIEGHVEASYGPFKVSGSYKQTHQEKKMNSKLDKASLSIPDPQIIAYICRPVPKCPWDPAKAKP